LLLGDSVLGASALMEHRIPHARLNTLSYCLKQKFEIGNYHALSLGSDSLLLPDMEGLSAEFSDHLPDKVLILLNFRMFSKEFGEGPKALSRYFLKGNLPQEIQLRLAPDNPPTQEARLSDWLYGGMCDHWALFRESQAAKTLWYYPSQKDFFQRILERMIGKNDAQSDILEAALIQKVGSYYQDYHWELDKLPFICLKHVLDLWVGRHIPVTVILTPQNQKFLGSYLDPQSFGYNRKILAEFMKRYASQGLHYQDWADRYPSDCFLDHCHMTPEGNRRYAEDLKLMIGGEAP
jgi:hypothetical protein